MPPHTYLDSGMWLFSHLITSEFWDFWDVQLLQALLFHMPKPGDYHFCTFNKTWTHIMCIFKPCLQDVCEDEDLTMVTAANKSPHFSWVNYSITKNYFSLGRDALSFKFHTIVLCQYFLAFSQRNSDIDLLHIQLLDILKKSNL